MLLYLALRASPASSKCTYAFSMAEHIHTFNADALGAENAAGLCPARAPQELCGHSCELVSHYSTVSYIDVLSQHPQHVQPLEKSLSYLPLTCKHAAGARNATHETCAMAQLSGEALFMLQV